MELYPCSTRTPSWVHKNNVFFFKLIVSVWLFSTKSLERFKLANVSLVRFAVGLRKVSVVLCIWFQDACAGILPWQIRHYNIYRRVEMRSDVCMIFISAPCNRMAKHWFRSISNFLFFPLGIFEKKKDFYFCSSSSTQSCNSGAILDYRCFSWGRGLWREIYDVMMSSSLSDVFLSRAFIA